jgi:hypothetical protein
MIWRCVSGIHWESGKSRTGLFPRTHNLPDFNRYLYNLSQIPSEQIKSYPDDFRHQDFVGYQDWYRLVQIYTERELTKRSDKLPAIGSVANILQDRIKDSYCAGFGVAILFSVLYGNTTFRYGNQNGKRSLSPQSIRHGAGLAFAVRCIFHSRSSERRKEEGLHP